MMIKTSDLIVCLTMTMNRAYRYRSRGRGSHVSIDADEVDASERTNTSAGYVAMITNERWVGRRD